MDPLASHGQEPSVLLLMMIVGAFSNLSNQSANQSPVPTKEFLSLRQAAGVLSSAGRNLWLICKQRHQHAYVPGHLIGCCCCHSPVEQGEHYSFCWSGRAADSSPPL